MNIYHPHNDASRTATSLTSPCNQSPSNISRNIFGITLWTFTFFPSTYTWLHIPPPVPLHAPTYPTKSSPPNLPFHSYSFRRPGKSVDWRRCILSLWHLFLFAYMLCTTNASSSLGKSTRSCGRGTGSDLGTIVLRRITKQNIHACEAP